MKFPRSIPLPYAFPFHLQVGDSHEHPFFIIIWWTMFISSVTNYATSTIVLVWSSSTSLYQATWYLHIFFTWFDHMKWYGTLHSFYIAFKSIDLIPSYYSSLPWFIGSKPSTHTSVPQRSIMFLASSFLSTFAHGPSQPILILIFTILPYDNMSCLT